MGMKMFELFRWDGTRRYCNGFSILFLKQHRFLFCFVFGFFAFSFIIAALTQEYRILLLL